MRDLLNKPVNAMRAFKSLSLLVGMLAFGSAAQAQVPLRYMLNPNFDTYLNNAGALLVNPTPAALLTACGSGGFNGFVKTAENTTGVRVQGWRSTDTAGGGFNNCGAIAAANPVTEIFANGSGPGTAQSGNFWNHNNPNQAARTYQFICLAPSDTMTYSMFTRGRNDVNERLAIGIWTPAAVNTFVASAGTAAVPTAAAGNTVGGGNTWGVQFASGATGTWQSITSAANPFGGGTTLPAGWTPGTYAVGMQSARGSGAGAGGALGTGSTLEGEPVIFSV